VQLSEETKLLNGQERAVAFVGALPDALCLQVEPSMWSQGEEGMYTLEQAFQVAERMDLARALAVGRRRSGEQQQTQLEAATTGVSIINTQLTGPCLRATAVGSMGTKRTRVPCHKRWSVKHGHAAMACLQKTGTPSGLTRWLNPG
jgi:hypothetical protein